MPFESIERMASVLSDRKNFQLSNTHPLLNRLANAGDPMKLLSKFCVQIFGDEIIKGMNECREIFSRVKVDRTRVKPIVKITGEFWAQTTEGDGNFNMFQFLEQEGAQVIVEPIATWLLYMLHQAKQELSDRKNVGINPDERGIAAIIQRLKMKKSHARKLAVFTLAEYLFKREYDRLRGVFHDLPGGLPNQYELQRIAHPYYNSRSKVGKGILRWRKTSITRIKICATWCFH